MVQSENMEYIHEVTTKLYDTEYDDANRAFFTFRSTARYYNDFRKQVKAAVAEWLKSTDSHHELELNNAIMDATGCTLSSYYREGIDTLLTDEDKEDLTPITDLVVTWRMVSYFLPTDIANKHGFDTSVTTSNEEDEDENLNA